MGGRRPAVSPLGLPRAHHRSTDSTNERAKALALAGAPHGTLVTADDQTAGRGRQGRVWTAPPGAAVLMSLVIRDVQALLPLAAAVAVCEAAEEATPVSARVKWPNDVWIEGRKLAGILIEGRPQEGWAVLGVGVNVGTEQFPEELRGVATSLTLEAPVPRPYASGEVLQMVVARLERWLVAGASEILQAWRARDALLGREVAWAGGRGTSAGIDDAGSLLVDAPGGRVTLEAGEVHLQRV